MSRGPRSIRPGSIYHLISQFVASEWFIQNEFDRARYLDLFGSAIATSDWTSFSYAIMSNHVHHALIAGEQPLGSWIRDAHGEFAEWINDRYRRIGAVFVRGPKTYEFNLDGVGNLVAYIHRNPVRAGVVANARQSTWTSHGHYLCPDGSPPWLNVEVGLELMGFSHGDELDRWVDATPIERRQLDVFRTHPPRRGGRPKANKAPVSGQVHSIHSTNSMLTISATP